MTEYTFSRSVLAVVSHKRTAASGPGPCCCCGWAVQAVQSRPLFASGRFPSRCRANSPSRFFIRDPPVLRSQGNDLAWTPPASMWLCRLCLPDLRCFRRVATALFCDALRANSSIGVTAGRNRDLRVGVLALGSFSRGLSFRCQYAQRESAFWTLANGKGTSKKNSSIACNVLPTKACGKRLLLLAHLQLPGCWPFRTFRGWCSVPAPFYDVKAKSDSQGLSQHPLLDSLQGIVTPSPLHLCRLGLTQFLARMSGFALLWACSAAPKFLNTKARGCPSKSSTGVFIARKVLSRSHMFSRSGSHQDCNHGLETVRRRGTGGCAL